jgi:phage baseplate assembly protein W
VNSLYTIPFKCQDIIDKKKQVTCALTDSIRQHIHLIFRTHFKEYRYDDAFGNLVWEKDFETIRSVHKWKNELTEAFYIPLVAFEKRLSQIRLNINLDELKIIDPSTQKVIEVRKRITIGVEGVMAKTNESFYHTEYIFFSPLSMT